MAKKRSWFSLVKRFFISDTHSKPEKKDKRRKWMFGRLKVKRLASIAATSPTKEIKLAEAEEEQSKHTVTVAIVTAAAAEAAAAAADVTDEVVRLTGTPQSTQECGREIGEGSAIEIKMDVPQSIHQCEREILELAAIKIQSTFRGYLARKALRALKGIVKLQAIIRGRNVRRHAITTLKCLQSIVNIQSQICTRRHQMAGSWHHDENKQSQTSTDKIIKMDSNSQRRWDDSILTKQDADAMFLSKKNAFIRRERIREYWFSHRKSAESEHNKVNGRWRYCLEQWVDTQVRKSKELEDLDRVWTSNTKPGEAYRRKELRLKDLHRRYRNDGLDSPVLVPGRSFHRKQNSPGDEKSSTSSPVLPIYMAETESAKAKSRSPSSPKLKPGSFGTYSDSYSPCKNNLSLISSVASEVPSFGRTRSRPSAYQQRSPSLKNIPGPIKSSRTAKDLSFDSECSLLNWNRQSTFR